MFGKELPMNAKCAILLVLILALLVTAGVAVNVHSVQTIHQVAWGPDIGASTTSASWGSSARFPILIQPLASWGS
jgi:hypothetical protein